MKKAQQNMIIHDTLTAIEKRLGFTHHNHENIVNTICRKIDPPLPVYNNGTLEINLVPPKVCAGDCIYCPYKATLRKTVERESFYQVGRIISNVVSQLKNDGIVENIVLSGCGDPALNVDIAVLMRRLKALLPVRMTVKSCGTLLWRESVCNDLMNADAVHVNVDAANKDVYRIVNKYHLQVPYIRYLDGISNFRQRFTGKFVLNVHLLEGLNTDLMHLDKLCTLLRQLDPAKIILYTFPSEVIASGQIKEVDSGTLHSFMSRCSRIAAIELVNNRSQMQQGENV